jgi:hypothetical protein
MFIKAAPIGGLYPAGKGGIAETTPFWRGYLAGLGPAFRQIGSLTNPGKFAPLPP